MANKKVEGTGGTPKQRSTETKKPLARDVSKGAPTTPKKPTEGKEETTQSTITARKLEEKGKTPIASFQSSVNAFKEAKDNVTKSKIFDNFIINHNEYLKSVDNCKLFINEIKKMKGVDAEFKSALLKDFTDKLREHFTLTKSLNDHIHNVTKNLNLAAFQSFITRMKAYSEMPGPGGTGTIAKNDKEHFQKDIKEAFNAFINEHGLTVANVKNFADEIKKLEGTSTEFKLSLLDMLIRNEVIKKHETLTDYIDEISQDLRRTAFQTIVEQFKVDKNNQQAQGSFDALIDNYFVTIGEVKKIADEIKKMKGASTELKLALLDVLVSNKRLKNTETVANYIKEISDKLKGYNLKPLRQIVQKNVDYIKDIKTKLTNTTSYYSGDTLPKSITNLLGSHQNIQGATFNNLDKATKLLIEIENHLKQSTKLDSNEAMAVDFLSSMLNADSSNPFLKVGEAFQYYQQLTKELAQSHTTTFDKTTFVEQMQKIDTAYNAVFPKLEELVKNMPDSKKKEELIKLLNESKKQKTRFDEAVELIRDTDIPTILADLKEAQGKEMDTTESIVKKAFAIAAVGLIIASVAALIAGLLMSGIGAIILLIIVGGLGLGLAATFGTVGFAKISVHGRQIDAAQEAFEELSKILKTSSKKSPPVAPKIMPPPKTPPANDNPWELST